MQLEAQNQERDFIEWGLQNILMKHLRIFMYGAKLKMDGKNLEKMLNI